MNLKKQSLKKFFFIILPVSIVFTGFCFYYSKNAITDKYPEIPFFPNITNSNEYKNFSIDSLIIEGIQQLKNKDRIILTYRKDTINRDSINFAILTNKMKPIYHSKFKNEIYYSYDVKNNKLLIVNSIYVNDDGNFTSKINDCQIVNTISGKKINIKEIDKTIYPKIKEKLKVIKHFSPFDYTEVIFFEDDSKNLYFVKNEFANEISTNTKLDKNLNFNFGIDVMLGGNPKIKNENIFLFDKIVTNQKIRVNTSLDYNSNYSVEAEKEHKQNEGYTGDNDWIEKDRLYYFKIKLKNNEVKFKSDLYYYSDFYFVQLNNIKSDNDTLFYYCQNKIYSFCKK